MEDGELTFARSAAHTVFDTLWKSRRKGSMSREKAYSWMAEKLRLTEDEAHIGRLSVVQCRRLISLVKEYLGGIPPGIETAVKRYETLHDETARKALSEAIIPWFYDDVEALKKLMGEAPQEKKCARCAKGLGCCPDHPCARIVCAYCKGIRQV